MRRSLFGSSPRAESTVSVSSEAEGNGSNASKRRTAFAFMKYSPKTSTTPNTMRRTREHAKRIALQLSTNASLSPTIDYNEDTHYGINSASDDLFFSQSSGPASPAPIKTRKQKSAAFDLKPLIHTQSEKQPNKRLDAFVERELAKETLNENQRPPKFSSFSASSVISQETGVSVNSKNSRTRSIKSMPTFPSNSTMQAANVHRRQATTSSSKNMDDPALSPYPLINSNRSFGSVGSTGKSNRLTNYSQTPRLPITPGSASSSRASGGGGASTNSTATLSPANSVNFFTEGIENGFSFDAFGLDASMVDREVSAAMKELAGEWGVGGGVDDFPVQSFDSPTASRSRSPSPDQFDEDGFEDGFRLTGISGLPLQPRQSPAGLERSSLSSQSNPWEDKGISRQAPPPQPQARQQQEHHVSDDGWATFGDSPFGKSSFGEPLYPNDTQSEPGFFPASKLPRIPVLDKSSPLTVADAGGLELNTMSAVRTGSRGDLSSVSAATDSDIVFHSDVGVSSEVGVNSNVGEIPAEVKGSKEKKSYLQNGVGEEKKDYELDIDDESFAEWSVRSPVKRIETWGNDITPLAQDDVSSTQLHPQRPQQAREEPQVKSALKSALSDVSSLKSVAKKVVSQQELRVMECSNQRTSLNSLKARLKAIKRVESPNTYAKSDVGSLRSGLAQSEMSAVLNRMRNGSPSESYVRSDDGCKSVADVRSDSGGKSVANLASKFDRPSKGTSSFAYAAKGQNQESHQGKAIYKEHDIEKHEKNAVYDNKSGRHQSIDSKLQSSRDTVQQPQDHTSLSYSERNDVQLRQQAIYSENPMEDKPRKLTYREQRELELRNVREEKERQAANERLKAPPDRDVAALIRKRIATNKQSAIVEADSKVENFGNVKNRLKRVSIESKITQFHAKGETQAQGSPKKERIPSSLFDSESVSSPQSYQVTAPGESHDLYSHVSEDVASVDNMSKAESALTDIHESIATSVAAEKKPGEELATTPTEDAVQSIADSTADTKAQLNAFFARRLMGGPSRDDAADKVSSPSGQEEQDTTSPASPSTTVPPHQPTAQEEVLHADDGRPALKNDPKYDRYFRMLKVGMPMPVVKHAMTRDGVDPSVMDGDHNKPAGFGAGVPLNQDPKYTRYFKMLNMGLPMGAVKNAMERDGLDPSVMERDHNLPANITSASTEDRGDAMDDKKVKDTHRRTRLHWDTARLVRSNSLWAKINQDEELETIQIDEDEFQELFQAELTPVDTNKTRVVHAKKGAAVRVIDSKRANNGGIILARLKMTHDELADAVDRIDHQGMSPEQMQNIIEYLPTSDERKALEVYMLSGGIDAAEKFDGLCECEKFMVAMMTVKHAKRKVRALLFKLQFQSCLDSLETDTAVVESACDELINSVRLRKLLGIVLNVGNRLNTAGVSGKGKAGAFSLESLLKLNHAKAFDKKTTFLHYIVLVVQRNNELLLRVKDDLPTVVKGSRVYWDQLEQDLEEVENQLENVRKISLHQARLMTSYRLRKKKKAQETEDDENSLSDSSMTLEEEVESLRASDIGIFTLGAIKKVSSLRDKVEVTKGKFLKLREYFGEEDKEEMQPHEIFNIITTFCRDFEKAKDEVSNDIKKKMREERMLKRTGSDPNLLTQGTPPPIIGNVTPNKTRKDASQQGRTGPLLRVSNHQPSVHQVLKPDRPPRNDHHASPTFSRSQSMPVNGQQTTSNAFVDSPVKEKQQNGSHSYAGKARPPMKPIVPKERDDDVASQSTQMPHSAMRQKAMQRRRRAQGPNSSGDISVSSTITSFPSMDRSTDATYAALGRRVAEDSINQLSPRSTIRQRRRVDQRRAVATNDQVVMEWPDEDNDFLQEVDFALD